MMQEQFEDIEVRYVLINKFEWKDAFNAERFAGHPKENQVYRCIYNKHTKNTKILLDSKNMVLIDDFNYEGDWVHLERENIIQQNLPEPELDKIIKWLDSDDIKKHYNQPPVEVMSLKGLLEAMATQGKEEDELIDRAAQVFLELNATNSIQAELILEIAECVSHETLLEHDGLAEMLTLHPDHSTGVNITRALEAITRYVSTDRRTNLDSGDLVVAILSLLKELESNILNERE